MVKSQLNMTGTDSEKGMGLGEDEFIEDTKAKILAGLAQLKRASQPPSEVDPSKIELSEAEDAAAGRIAELAQEALGYSACREIIVCRTDGGFLVLNAISHSKPDRSFGTLNDTLRRSPNQQRELRNYGISFMSVAEASIGPESIAKTLNNYQAKLIQRFPKP